MKQLWWWVFNPDDVCSARKTPTSRDAITSATPATKRPNEWNGRNVEHMKINSDNHHGIEFSLRWVQPIESVLDSVRGSLLPMIYGYNRLANRMN